MKRYFHKPCLLGAYIMLILAWEIVVRDRYLLPGASDYRVVSMANMLLNPLAWVSVWIVWRSTLGNRRSPSTAQEKRPLSPARHFFIREYFSLVVLVLPVVFVFQIIYGTYVYHSFLALNPHIAGLFSTRLLVGWLIRAEIINTIQYAFLTPIVVYFLAIAFPRSARNFRCVLVSGLAMVFLPVFSFWLAMMLKILLRVRYDLLPNVLSPMIEVQILQMIIILAPAIMMSFYVVPRFKRFSGHDRENAKSFSINTEDKT